MARGEGGEESTAAAAGEESWAAYAGVFTTDRRAAAGRAARDSLRDVFGLLGLPERAVRLGGVNGRLVVSVGPLSVEHADKLARALMSGMPAGRPAVQRDGGREHDRPTGR
ncbi:hypothetical protein [Streptomyces sp. YIM 98790]|uniref:hypothetical protein n=1 Tax=Streptomyces sp. YIM 98790 TaxID=2689077 RepID=UPI001408EA41|nr:hypothetical protein [Streptomyces sp. YIM 98790]